MCTANQTLAAQTLSYKGVALSNPLYTSLLKLVNDTNTQAALEKEFAEIARLLLLQTTLKIAEKSYQLIDVEFYFYNLDFHPDPYSHSCQYAKSVRSKQSVTGTWYFHRFTGMDKYTHTRRGLDLTYGDGERQRYGGILIRAMKSLTDKRIIIGPSRVVGEIISAMDNDQELERLAYNMNAGVAFNPSSLLHLEALASAIDIPLYSTTRFGISDKDHAYQQKHYRFFTDSKSQKKIKGLKLERP